MRPMLLLFLLMAAASALAADEKIFSMSFGPVRIGESRVPVSVDDFEIDIQSPRHSIEARIEPDSIQWIRSEGHILSPRARISLSIEGDASRLHLKYLDRTILLQNTGKSGRTEMYVSLFYPESIQIMEGDKSVGHIVVRPKPFQNRRAPKTKLIDYSCAPFNLELDGLDDQYVSVSCHLSRKWAMGHETPMLEVVWTATNVRLLDGALPPYMATLVDEHPVTMTVKMPTGKEEHFSIRATLPEHLPRLKMAGGLGPYSFKSREGTQERASRMAGAGMLYINYMLTDETSLRGFDALIAQDSQFNNAGLYFAYELARPFDQRMQITALLGLQSLSFRYNHTDTPYTQIIYPQGFEIVLKHFWGKENHDLVFGMFISPTKSEDYNNLWLRYGKRVFGELNYISWSHGDQKASLWGLSLGFPIASFF